MRNPAATRPSRLGLALFGVYTALYAAFVALTAFGGDVMEATPLAGLNVAVLYGFGLIVVAVVFAVLYGALAKDDDHSDEAGR